MFEGEIIMLPERKGNRTTADVMTAKTESLGWCPRKNIKSYIETIKINGWND